MLEQGKIRPYEQACKVLPNQMHNQRPNLK